MRTVLLLALVSVGCTEDGGSCETDSDCGGDVCARDGVCYPADEVRAIRVTWTVNAQAASATTCMTSPDLEVDFSGEAGQGFLTGIGFSPVPCSSGLFNVDKMPTIYTEVDVFGASGPEVSSPLDGDGNASVDLSF